VRRFLASQGTVRATKAPSRQVTNGNVGRWGAHHFDGPQGAEGVRPAAAGPRVPAGILAFLEHELLPLAVGLLVAYPAAGDGDRDKSESTKHRGQGPGHTTAGPI
jgi:hypothetical protein